MFVSQVCSHQTCILSSPLSSDRGHSVPLAPSPPSSLLLVTAWLIVPHRHLFPCLLLSLHCSNLHKLPPAPEEACSSLALFPKLQLCIFSQLPQNNPPPSFCLCLSIVLLSLQTRTLVTATSIRCTHPVCWAPWCASPSSSSSVVNSSKAGTSYVPFSIFSIVLCPQEMTCK